MGANTAMAPEDFTMWLRGVLDLIGEGEPIPADVAQTLYTKLSEVVAGQVANRLLEQEKDKPNALDEARIQMEQLRIQYEYEIALRKIEAQKLQAMPVTYGTTGTGLKLVG